MNPELKELAKKAIGAEFAPDTGGVGYWLVSDEELAEFAALIAEKVGEKIAARWPDADVAFNDYEQGQKQAIESCAEAATDIARGWRSFPPTRDVNG